VTFELFYLPECWEDVSNIPRDDLRRIKKAIETRLPHAPDLAGKPLKGTLKGLWRLRTGDYRIIYRIEPRQVFILRIGNRKDVYED
jgi:mRNA interferase RelE/StbE